MKFSFGRVKKFSIPLVRKIELANSGIFLKQKITIENSINILRINTYGTSSLTQFLMRKFGGENNLIWTRNFPNVKIWWEKEPVPSSHRN